MNEYLKALEDINLGQKEEPNYLTLRYKMFITLVQLVHFRIWFNSGINFRLKEEYVASVFGFSANSLKIRSPCLTPGYNPFDVNMRKYKN